MDDHGLQLRGGRSRAGCSESRQSPQLDQRCDGPAVRTSSSGRYKYTGKVVVFMALVCECACELFHLISLVREKSELNRTGDAEARF